MSEDSKELKKRFFENLALRKNKFKDGDLSFSEKLKYNLLGFFLFFFIILLVFWSAS